MSRKSKRKNNKNNQNATTKNVITKRDGPVYPSSKRLSCVGNSFLKLCVTNVLFQTFPFYREGKLTQMTEEILPKLLKHLQKYSNGGRFRTCAFIGNFLYLNGAKLTAMFLKNFIPVEEGEEKNATDSVATATILSPSIISFYHEKQFQKLEEQIGYKFQNQLYLLQAFTRGCHELAKFNGHYQRLEFLGDSVLEYLISRYLYNHASKFEHHHLVKFRSKFTKNKTFATISLKNGFQNYVLHSNKIKGQKCYADIFESLAAAIYIDSGMNLDIVWNVFYQLMKKFDDFDKLDSAHASICVTQ